MESLISELTQLLVSGEPLDDDEFGCWAMRVYAAQRSENPILERFWAASGKAVDRWEDIPPVPASVFKTVPVHRPGPVEAVFRTSGTTQGAAARGEHHVVSMALYRAASVGHMKASLLPHGVEQTSLLALVPDPRSTPDSSLGQMIDFLAEEGFRDVTWGWHPTDGVDLPKVFSAVARGGCQGPVLLVTTAFALVNLLDALKENGRSLLLPAGSGIMETGGFKGRVVEVSREELYARAFSSLGVPMTHIINEYGMTELLSQAYDGVVGKASPLDDRRLRFPSWVRTRALDPESLAVLPPGQTGLLCHWDLANVGSACPVLTEDVGWVDACGGLVLLARATKAEPRGCSLMAEAFLRSSGRDVGEKATP